MSEVIKYSGTRKQIECPVCKYAHLVTAGGACIVALKKREAALREALIQCLPFIAELRPKDIEYDLFKMCTAALQEK
jgi:hypothetical protein